jgi:FkbM family methyltransferase
MSEVAGHTQDASATAELQGPRRTKEHTTVGHAAMHQSRAEGRVDELVRARFFPTAPTGVLVEVGAADPEYLSTSALYRDLGWTVLSVEPNPEFCQLHRARGHEVLQYACGDHDEDGVDFSVVDSGGAEYGGGKVSYESFSSIAIKDSYADLASSDLTVSKIKVDLRRLDTLLAEQIPAIERIDLLSIDVEGWELEVLGGLDMDSFRPRVLIIENLFADDRYREYMRARGYELWRHVEPNDVYVAGREIGTQDRIKRRVMPLASHAWRLGSSLRAKIHA